MDLATFGIEAAPGKFNAALSNSCRPQLKDDFIMAPHPST